MSHRPTPETDTEFHRIRTSPSIFVSDEMDSLAVLARNLERQRDEAREELINLRVENDHNWQANADLEEMIKLARELRDALDGVIFSASPNRRDNPTMFAAWEEARPILAKAKEVLK